MPHTAVNDASPVGSVDKALVLLELLAEAGPSGASLRELTRDSGFNKGSIHRLLRALAYRGYVERDADQHNYRLGNRPALLTERYFREENLPMLFRPALLRICQQTQELVHLGILEDTSVRYLDKVEPDRTLRVWSRVGRRAPAAGTALGRAMIAASEVPDTALEVYLSGPDNDESTVSADRLREAVRQAQRRGYAVEREENEAGISCVGVALTRPVGQPVAVSITGPTSRLTAARQRELGELLRAELTAWAPFPFAVLAS